jgi:hypothetical protein
MNQIYINIFQFKITLRGIQSPIWRRIQVPESFTFDQLHRAIQDAMGWEDYHLYEFQIMDPSKGSVVNIGVPEGGYVDGILSGKKQKIKDFFSLENHSAQYLYDFGDNWEHTVKLEKILPAEEGGYPRCITGKRACPPEDCGGVWGYMELLEVLADPDHDEYEDMLEWAGEDFDPEYFDAKEVRFR